MVMVEFSLQIQLVQDSRQERSCQKLGKSQNCNKIHHHLQMKQPNSLPSH